MKKKWIALLVILLVLLTAGAAYLGIAYYYRNTYSFGTWINEIYCTGKTPEQVNKELLEKEVFLPIVVVDKEGNKEEIALSELDYEVDYSQELLELKNKQNPYFWGENLIKGDASVVYGEHSYNEEKLFEKVENLKCIKSSKEQKKRETKISYSNDGFILEDQTQDVLREDLVYEVLKTALSEQSVELDLAALNCYEDQAPDSHTREVYTLWNKVDQFQNFHMTYEFGENTELLDASIISKWISVDEDGNFLLDKEENLILDEKKVEEYIESLAKKYDTIGKKRTFITTQGKEIEVEGGIYGNELDQKAELAFLLEAFAKGESCLHAPAYKKKALHQGVDDIGDTYIEINMTRQTMYCYIDGKLFMETPIVTGNTSRKRGTPTGTNYVYGKQKNRTLRGPNYASFVHFWMPVKGNVGIHDAPWRSEYGGEIYKTNGSHGCINTPYDAMQKIYEKIEIGTPVIMFYEEKM